MGSASWEPHVWLLCVCLGLGGEARVTSSQPQVGQVGPWVRVLGSAGQLVLPQTVPCLVLCRLNNDPLSC